MGLEFFPHCAVLCSENTPGEDRCVTPKKKPHFFIIFIQLLCSLAQKLTVGVVTGLLLPTSCRASRELHHLASVEQLSENTFGFARVAPAPFPSLPGFLEQSRRSGSSQCPRSTPWDAPSHGHCTPQNHPKSCSCSRNAPVLGESAKSRVLNSSWLIPSASLGFPSDFSWSCVLPLPARSEPACPHGQHSLPFPLRLFLLCSAGSALPRLNIFSEELQTLPTPAQSCHNQGQIRSHSGKFVGDVA